MTSQAALALSALAVVACSSSAAVPPPADPAKPTSARPELPPVDSSSVPAGAELNTAPADPWPGQVAALVGPLLQASDAPPAISVATIRNRRTEFFGYGQLGPGLGPPNADTLFHVASLTKPHTALLTALLVGEDKLELDQPFAKCRRGRPRAFCGRSKTSLRHLLTHSSGLRMVPKNSGGPYTRKNLRSYLRDTRPKDDVPGRGFRYSTTGFGAIALRLAELSRRSYEQLLADRVLTPIGSQARFDLDKGDRARLAPGVNRKGELAPAGPTREAFVASGGLIASARDLAKLLEVHANPGAHPAFANAVEVTRIRNMTLRGFQGSGLAIGWFVERKRGYYWHPGVSSVHRSVIAYDPVAKTAVAVLASRYLSVSDSRLEDAAFAILDLGRK